ncbi:hypothetical protein [Saccharopolyspora taberi]|uniref:Uncharacterized protein n=1 Tax=Saccharopolyspora taberi TaxID=60895 RepID=A0ABN3VFF9_9PSEU
MDRQPSALNAAVADLERALAGRPAESVSPRDEDTGPPGDEPTEDKGAEDKGTGDKSAGDEPAGDE